ncbi:Holliday junction resolvase RuvX [Saxibacter everestensis]|uniref:Putative pre-16S rRNA nuclease n=1 Tax=Saxibacter everestensis TaxID=2909229 RepID=A0ABY8QZM8_9MICO|nr:Holliday junction resolvase RuvX [Brevibacteriaceae bacterium ZFBP1038]
MFRRGVRLGVDVGSVRVGLAACDPDGILATPVESLPRDDSGSSSDIRRIAEEVTERNALEVIVGLPRSLDGTPRKAAELATEYARRLASSVAPVPVRMVDERMTTIDAHRALRTSGVSGRKQRKVVDAVAAVIILQHAVDMERQTGRAPGDLVTGGAAPDTQEGR